MLIRLTGIALVTLLTVSAARGACVNRFTRHSEGSRNIVTMLTGKLTFQDAQSLSAAIRDGKADPLEWVDSNGKSISKQFGELKVIRPITIACENNRSGVIMIAIFPSGQAPGKTMLIKFGTERVAFELQE